MLVLVADDDPETCALVAAVLKQAGHTCIIARDAMQVVQLAGVRRPHLIVLDLQMPAGTGVGALEKLKLSTRTASIPVLVLSGARDPAVIERVLQLGALEFLPKPVDPDALVAATSRAVESAPSPPA
jgi:DNA-binding response OmpR family regulator